MWLKFVLFLGLLAVTCAAAETFDSNKKWLYDVNIENATPPFTPDDEVILAKKLKIEIEHVYTDAQGKRIGILFFVRSKQRRAVEKELKVLKLRGITFESSEVETLPGWQPK